MKLTEVAAYIALGLVGLVLCLAISAGCYGCSNVTVSDGYRDSTVRKFSKTGLLFETYEVETLGDGLVRNESGRLAPETFQYSVRPDQKDVIDTLQNIPGDKKVRIHYRKALTVWTPKGESRYSITKVEDLK